jgi:general stress protein 26
MTTDPLAELHPDFSSPDATATRWPDALARLEGAEIYWLSTVRPDGRPHVTPLIAVVLDGTSYFCTGPTERKAHNLEANRSCVLTTGCNDLGDGFDVVVEGEAVRVADEPTLQRVVDAYARKYPEPFRFAVRDGVFVGDGGEALVFGIRPKKAFGFGRGTTYSQTRWRFEPA